jgi:hypothetical protein
MKNKLLILMVALFFVTGVSIKGQAITMAPANLVSTTTANFHNCLNHFSKDVQTSLDNIDVCLGNSILGLWTQVGTDIYNNNANGNVGINTTAPAAQLEVDGALYLNTANMRIFVKSPNGSCFVWTVDNNGNIISSPSTCPTRSSGANLLYLGQQLTYLGQSLTY